MASVNLSVSQQMLLTALVNLYRSQGSVVSGEDIADEIDRAAGTVRNQMPSLKSLGLVETVAGRKGGYKPTAMAYETLGIDQIEQPATVPIRCNDELIDEVNVGRIHLTSVHHPTRCRAAVHVFGTLHDVHPGDEVRIGPTPLADLTIHGLVESIDATNSRLILNIDGMSAD